MTPGQYEQEATAISRLLDDLSIRIRRIVETKCGGFSAGEKDVLAKANELLQTSSGNLHSHTCGLRHILQWPEFELPNAESKKVGTLCTSVGNVGRSNSTKASTTVVPVVNKKMSLQELAAALHKSGLKADDIAKIRGGD